MENLKTQLKKKLKDAKKIAVLGIGSELRADDVAGLLVAEELKKNKNPKLKIFLGSTAPENFTGEIIKYNPTHIIIIDSMDMDREAGSTLLISPEEVGGVSFSTHMLPVKMMVDYLLASLKCEIIIIGIQPKILLFGGIISKEVEKSTKQISGVIQQILQEEF
ncbi:hydrogenase maturation protease [bacterium]|nr:hydrogenase maturation protease [bacterium]